MTSAIEQTPESILQRSLDETGAALETCDFERFSKWFWLPTSVATQQGVRLLKTSDEMCRTFLNVCAHFKSLGVTSVQRTVDMAVFDGPDTIRGAYTAWLYRGNELARPIYPSFSIMRQQDGEWRVADSQYAVEDSASHERALLKAGEDEGIASTQDADALMAVVQNNLDQVTNAYLKRDFDALSDWVRLPLFLQRSEATTFIASVDDMKTDFNRQMTEFDIIGVTDIVRLVKKAELVGPRRIVGLYRTYILSGSKMRIPAYNSAITLEQGDDLRWRVTSVMQPKAPLDISRVLGIDQNIK